MASKSATTWDDVQRDVREGRAYRASVEMEHGQPIRVTADYGDPVEEIDALRRENARQREMLEWAMEALWLGSRDRRGVCPHCWAQAHEDHADTCAVLTRVRDWRGDSPSETDESGGSSPSGAGQPARCPRCHGVGYLAWYHPDGRYGGEQGCDCAADDG